jgi:hypothetical protein
MTIPKIVDFSRQLVPVSVQGELVPGEVQIVRALAALIRKYGKDGRLEIDQLEAMRLLDKNYTVELHFSFERNALVMKCR